jgi:hypothetical protein
MSSRALTLVCTLAAIGACQVRSSAHDLPTNVTIQAFIKPEGRHLRLLVRVPLNAMADIDYPTRGPGGLVDLTRIDRALQDAVNLWLIPGVQLYEHGLPIGRPRLIAARMSLPSERAFSSYSEALAHVTGAPLGPDVHVYWNQTMLDALLEYDIRSDRSSFALRPTLARLGVRVVTALQFLPPDRRVRAFEFAGDPGLVWLDPRWHQAAGRFLQSGFNRILERADHLLLMACLAIPFRRLRGLVPVVTAFAAAEAIALFASAFDVTPDALWFPPLIDTLIAMSVLYVALENMLATRFDHRWVIAFGFGLIHGFGLSAALADSAQFAGSHPLAALVAFNLGIAISQLLVLAFLVPPLNLVFRLAASERIAAIVLSALIGHAAWHWMVERGDRLGQFTLQWPPVDAALAAKATLWLLLAVVSAGVLWLLSRLTRWMGQQDRLSDATRISRR